MKILEKNINIGYNVVLWPDSVVGKDINEMILSGKTVEEIVDMIKENTFSGLEAIARFSSWKKV